MIAAALLSGMLVAWPLRAVRADPPAAAGSAQQESRAAAKKEFSAGDAAYARGEFAAAAAHFEAAYGYAPHPAALLNAAQAWEGAKSFARAATLYAKYLKEAPPDATPRSAASASLKQLAPKVAELDITATGLTDVAVDDRPAEASVVYVEPGHHFVYARKEDRIARSDVDVTAGSVTQVTLTPPPEPAPPSALALALAPALAPVPALAPAPALAREEGAPVERATAQVKGHRVLPPWVVIAGSALTAVGIAGTVWSGLETANFKTSVYEPSPTTTNLDDGLTRERRTNFLLVATVGVAATTGVIAIWFVDWRGSGGGRSR
jgi:hypothetical protein